MGHKDEISVTRGMMDAAKPIKVRHKEGTAELKPITYDSWIEFWKNKKQEQQIQGKCPCCKKTVQQNEFVGAHVIDNANRTYITPTCNSCNSRYGAKKAESITFVVFKNMLVEVSEEEVSNL